MKGLGGGGGGGGREADVGAAAQEGKPRQPQPAGGRERGGE